MNVNNKFIYSLFAAIIILSACKKEDEEHAIVGSWTLTSVKEDMDSIVTINGIVTSSGSRPTVIYTANEWLEWNDEGAFRDFTFLANGNLELYHLAVDTTISTTWEIIGDSLYVAAIPGLDVQAGVSGYTINLPNLLLNLPIVDQSHGWTQPAEGPWYDIKYRYEYTLTKN